MAGVLLPRPPEESEGLFGGNNKKWPAKVQATGPQWSSPNHQEVFRQRFRQFCYKETPGPREALSQLWVFCCEWLRPEIRTKEQMLDLVVLEQFLTILPEELQAWVREHHPESGEQAVAVLEDLEKELDEPGQQVEKGPVLSAGMVGRGHQADPLWALGIMYTVGPSDAQTSLLVLRFQPRPVHRKCFLRHRCLWIQLRKQHISSFNPWRSSLRVNLRTLNTNRTVVSVDTWGIWLPWRP